MFLQLNIVSDVLSAVLQELRAVFPYYPETSVSSYNGVLLALFVYPAKGL